MRNDVCHASIPPQSVNLDDVGLNINDGHLDHLNNDVNNDDVGINGDDVNLRNINDDINLKNVNLDNVNLHDDLDDDFVLYVGITVETWCKNIAWAIYTTFLIMVDFTDDITKASVPNPNTPQIDPKVAPPAAASTVYSKTCIVAISLVSTCAVSFCCFGLWLFSYFMNKNLPRLTETLLFITPLLLLALISVVFVLISRYGSAVHAILKGLMAQNGTGIEQLKLQLDATQLEVVQLKEQLKDLIHPSSADSIASA